MAWKERAKKFGKWFAVAIGILLLLLFCAFAFLQTPFVKDRIADYVAQMASTPDMRVDIEGLRGFLPFDLRAERITLSDEQGEWLAVENVQLDWSPLSLIRGEVNIQELTAETIQMERKPVSSPEEAEPADGKPFSLPRNLPMISVQRLAVDEIRLATPVLGQEAVYTLAGQLSTMDQGEGMQAALNLEPIDAPDSRININASIYGDEPTLSIDTRIQDPEDGLLHGLLGLEDAGPLHAHLVGEGPLRDWQGDLNVQLENYGQIAGDIGIAYTEDLQITAKGVVRPARGAVPENIAPLLSEENTFDLSATLSESNQLAIDRFNIETADSTIRLEGDYNLDSQAFNARFDLRLAQMQNLEELTGMRLEGEAQLDGVLSGTLQNPQGKIQFNVNRARINDVTASEISLDIQITSRDTSDPSFPSTQIAGSGRATNLHVPGEQELPENITLDFNLGVQNMVDIEIERFDLHAPGLDVSLAGAANLEVPSVDLDLRVNASDLSKLAPLLGDQEMAGSAVLDASIAWNQVTQNLQADIQGRGQDLQGLPESFQDIVGTDFTLQAQAEIQEGTKLIIPRIKVNAAAGELIANASIDLAVPSAEADWRMNVEDLSRFSNLLGQETGGSVQISGTVSGTREDITLNADVRGENVRYGEYEIQDVTGNIQAIDLMGEPRGKINLDVTRDELRLRAGSDFIASASRIQLQNVLVEGPETTVRGDLAVDLDTNLIQGDLRGGSTDLSPLGRIFGEELEGSIEFDAQLSPEQGRQQASINLQGQQFRSRFGQAGEIDLNADVMDMFGEPRGDISLRGQDIQYEDIQVESIDLQAQGTMEQLDFQLEGAGEYREEFDIQTEGTLSFTEESQGIELRGLRGQYGGQRVEIEEPMRLDQLADGFSIQNLNLNLGAGELIASGEFSPDQVNLDVQAREIPLSLLNQFGIGDVTGYLRGNILVQGTPKKPVIKAELHGDRVHVNHPAVQDFSPGAIELNADYAEGRFEANIVLIDFLKEPIRASVNSPLELSLMPFEYSFPEQGRIEGQVSVNAPSLELDGKASIDPAVPSANADWRMNVKDLSRFSGLIGQDAGGSLQVNGKVSGTRENITLNADVQGRNVRYGEYELQNLKADVQATDLMGEPRGTLKLDVTRDNLRLQAGTDFVASASRVQLQELNVAGPATTLQGDLDINLESRLVRGDLKGRSSDLSRLGHIIGEDLEGAFRLNAQLDHEQGRQQAVIDLVGNEIQSRFGQAGVIDLKANLQDVMEEPRGELTLQGKGVQYQDIQVDHLDLQARGTTGQFDFRMRGAGFYQREFMLESEGILALAEETMDVSLNRFRGLYGGERIALNRPFRLRQSPEGYTIDNLDLFLGEGDLFASGILNQNRVDLDLRVRRMPLSLMNLFSETDATGSLNANIGIQGTPQNPRIRADVRGDKIHIDTPAAQNLAPATLQLNADYADGRFVADARLSELLRKPITASLDYPLQLSLMPFEYSVPEHGPIRGRLEGQMDMARLPELLRLNYQTITGVMYADVNMGGTVANPDVSGQVFLEKGSYDHLEQGIVLRDVNMRLNATPEALVVETMRATDGGSGRVTGSGEIGLKPPFPLNINLAMNNAALLRNDTITSEFGGKIALAGDVQNPLISGDVQVGPAEVRIPDSLPPHITEVEIIEVNREFAVNQRAIQKELAALAEEAEREASDRVIKIKLNVNIPNRVFIRGRGLDSEWSGKLDISGNADEPILTGNLSIVRGTFNFFGNRMDLTRGTVTFSGATPSEPYLDVQAETTKRNVTFYIRILGAASNPEIQLSSDPAMPQDEVLARLLFGRRLTEISPLQAIQLAQAANALRGGGGALDVMSQTRELLGLDQLELRQGDDGDFSDATLGIGKYLTEDIYVDIEKGLNDAEGRVKVEIEVTRNISVESEVGMDSSSGVGVKWKYDY